MRQLLIHRLEFLEFKEKNLVEMEVDEKNRKIKFRLKIKHHEIKQYTSA